jgi:hypothetical protein
MKDRSIDRHLVLQAELFAHRSAESSGDGSAQLDEDAADAERRDNGRPHPG